MQNKKIKKEDKIIDANGKILGRVASETAKYLTGKDKASFKRNSFSGMPVKIINASKIKITNKKLDQIVHKSYSGIPGGLKILKGSKIIKDKGFGELLKHAIYQMLPSNKIRKEMMKNLKIEE